MTEAFIYTNGRISGEETAFIDKRMWQMIISAPNHKEAIRLLADTWYGSFMQQNSIKKCFAKAMTSVEDDLIELAKDKRIQRSILSRRDVRNARYIWKHLFINGADDGTIEVERDGLINSAILRKAVHDEEAKADLPENFAAVIDELENLDNIDERKIDMIMDKFASGIEMNEFSSIDPVLANLAKIKIELKNFLIAGRASIMGLSAKEIEKMLFSDGFHTVEEIEEACRKSNLPGLISENTGFEEASEALAKALSSKSFLSFEKEMDRLLLDIYEEGTYPVFGPVRLLSYVFRKEMEISHLEVLLAAKTAGVGKERLQQRLPRG